MDGSRTQRLHELLRRLGKAVHGSKSGIGQRQAAEEAAEGHVGPRFEVIAMGIGMEQGAGYIIEALAAKAVSQRIGLTGNKGFEQLDEGIKSGTGGNVGRQGKG